MGGLITALIGVIMMPWKLMGNDGRLHFHLADRLLRTNGRYRRDIDLRLLGAAKTATGSGRPV